MGELRIGIIGGTFDPIHYGHLATAEEAKFRLKLQQIIFLPCGQPYHKKDYKEIGVRHRLEMTRLAIADNPNFNISGMEIERTGFSYTIDSVEEFRKIYPEAKLYFITGADAVLEILTWKEPKRLIEMCELVAATRPGYNLATFQQSLEKEIASRVHHLSVPGVDISSSEIRKRVVEGAPIRYLLPDKVIAYIERERLYR